MAILNVSSVVERARDIALPEKTPLRGITNRYLSQYDWRLSPHLLSERLADFLKPLPSNQPGFPAAERGVLVIAHSLGGLITRHVVNKHPELFSGVVYAGTP